MNNIKELLNDEKSILVFDVDGVLAVLEFGEHNHYSFSDEDWDNYVDSGNNPYIEDKVSKKMQKFINKKNKNKIYVITAIGVNKEGEYKKEYVEKYYSILPENVYFVDRNNDKTSKLVEIRKNHPEVDDRHIIMIDDTPDILTDIQLKTDFSTAHISSFLDI